MDGREVGVGSEADSEAGTGGGIGSGAAGDATSGSAGTDSGGADDGEGPVGASCGETSCLNGGVCTDLLEGFSCNCLGTGFSGQRCEQPIDDCAGAPCVNGTCVDASNGYTCSCDVNWHGELCEIQTFQGLGVNPLVVGNCLANAVSGDGTTVVGTCDGSVDAAFKWTRDGFTMLPGDGSSANAEDVTQNGLVVVGTVRSGGLGRGALWTGNAAPRLFAPSGPDAAETWSLFHFVSVDGSLVVGEVQPADRLVVQLWSLRGLNPTTSLVDPLGNYSDEVARGVSGDGLLVFGGAEGPDAAWRRRGNGSIEALYGLAGDETPSVRGADMDGSVVVGGSEGQVVRWLDDSTTAESLGFAGVGQAVSADGSVIVGSSEGVAFVWTSETSRRSLSSMLEARGIDLTGWVLESAIDISLDGKVIVGRGTHDGADESWIVRVP